jgi:dienelactone hydrolase
MKTRFTLLLLASFLATLAQAEVPTPPPVLSDEAHELLRTFHDYDDAIPLEARIVEHKDNDDTIREKIVFRGVRAAMVPGYLEVPKAGKAPYPCVLLMHGWSGSKAHWWKDGGYLHGGNARKALLDAGYAVFALDAQAHGDRIAENDYHVVNLYEDPGAPPRKNYFTLRDIITQTVRDYRRGIDYLETREEINADRIGIVGYSMGGFHAVSLTAVEPRIKAAAGCVVPVSWQEDPILNPANYVRAIGERPFMMLQGKTDGLCDEAQSRTLHRLFNPDTTRLVLFDAGHKLPLDWVDVAIPWLAEQL